MCEINRGGEWLIQRRSRIFCFGGKGILSKGGRLNYHPEEISEIYYNWHVDKYLARGFDRPHIVNPVYNTDRGPVYKGDVISCPCGGNIGVAQPQRPV